MLILRGKPDQGAISNHRFGTSNPINPPNSNVNCVKKMKEKEGQWNDVGCSKQLNYACSMEAVKTCA